MAHGDKFPGPYFTTGEFDGTGAAITITCGFRPMKVVIYNIDDAGGQTMAFWNKAMGQDKAVKWVDSGAGTTNGSFITSNGITANPNGFTIGTDSDINANTETMIWEAWRDSNTYGV